MPVNLDAPILKKEVVKNRALASQVSRLFDLRRQKKWTQKQVANQVGTSLTSYQAYEKGERELPGSIVYELAKLYNIPMQELVAASESDASELSAVSADMVDVPLIKGAISSLGQVEAAIDRYPIPRKLREEHPESFLFEVADNSVNRAIPKGAYALISPCEDFHDGSLYLVYLNNEAALDTTMLCRIEGDPEEGPLILAPDSTEMRWTELSVSNRSELRLLGKAVWYMWPYERELLA